MLHMLYHGVYAMASVLVYRVATYHTSALHMHTWDIVHVYVCNNYR